MFGLGRLALQPRAECVKWHVWLQRKFCECLEVRDHCQLKKSEKILLVVSEGDCEG